MYYIFDGCNKLRDFDPYNFSLYDFSRLSENEYLRTNYPELLIWNSKTKMETRIVKINIDVALQLVFTNYKKSWFLYEDELTLENIIIGIPIHRNGYRKLVYTKYPNFYKINEYSNSKITDRFSLPVYHKPVLITDTTYLKTKYPEQFI